MCDEAHIDDHKMILYETICYGAYRTRKATSPGGTWMTDIAAVEEVKTSTGAQGDRSRWIALIVLCVGMLMIVLDQTIVNVALPSIKDDLGFSQSTLAWVVNAYLIT